MVAHEFVIASSDIEVPSHWHLHYHYHNVHHGNAAFENPHIDLTFLIKFTIILLYMSIV